METPLATAHEEAITLVEWALRPSGTSNPLDEYASKSYLERVGVAATLPVAFPGPWVTKSLTYCRKARTGQRQCNLLSSGEEKGGGWNAGNTTGSGATTWFFVTKDRSGCINSLRPSESIRKQRSWMERAWRSLTRFAVEMATRKSVLRESIRRDRLSIGSN